MTQKLIAFTLLVLGTSFAQQTKTATPASLAAATKLANDQLADKKIVELINVRWTVEKREVDGRERYITDAGEAERALQSNIRNQSLDIIENFANAVARGHAGNTEICKASLILDAAMKRWIETQLGSKASTERKQYEVDEQLRTPGIQLLYSTIGKCTLLQPWVTAK